jgi:putative FmdB family regulatory protein
VPTYDYQCRSCGAVTEVIHSMLVDGPSVCDNCGGALRRVLYPTGIIFKGSGFYSTDSRAASSSTSGPAKKDAPASGDAKPSTSSSEGSAPSPSVKDASSE